jgi:hypothetical protein
MAALLTASGASFATLSLGDARTFLERYGPSGFEPADRDRSWGAFEGAGPLVGVGVLAAVAPPRGRAWITVAPERRRLGMGGELAGLVVAAAQQQGLRYLTCGHRAGDPAGDRLARSLPVARRVSDGVVWTVALLPQKKQGEDR